MELYHLTLKRQSNYLWSLKGSFLRGEDELCLVTQSHVELYSFSGKRRSKIGNDIPVFTSILAADVLKNGSTGTDYLVLLGDNGNLVVCRFISVPTNNIYLEPVFIHKLDTGLIRAINPQISCSTGSILVVASQNQRIVVPIDWTSQRFLSPLAFPQDIATVVVHMVSLRQFPDQYVTLELTADPRLYTLHFWHFDRNLMSLVRSSSYNLKSNDPRDTPSFLIDLPDLKSTVMTTLEKSSTQSNPFVVICFNTHILIKDMLGLYSLKCEYPSEVLESNEHVMIVASDIQIMKNNSFLLLTQMNTGHLFKICIEPNESDRNRPVAKFCYFDKIPNISNSTCLNIFGNGSMYINSQFLYDHLYLNFEGLGDNDENYDKIDNENENLTVISKHENLNPLIKNINVTETTPFTLLHCQGSSAESGKHSINILKNAVPLTEFISSPLPGGVSNLFTVKLEHKPYHSFIVLSMVNFSTVILKIENDSIEQFTPGEDSFKLQDDMTLHIGSMASNTIIQVCKNEMRHIIVNDKTDDFTFNFNWLPPAGVSIVSAASNSNQVVLGLSNNEVVYFQLNKTSLVEYQYRPELDDIITCIALVENSHLSSPILVVGTRDSTINILSLEMSDKNKALQVIAFQSLDAIPSSLLILEKSRHFLNMHIGLDDGTYLVNNINLRSMHITNEQKRNLGSRAIKRLNYVMVDLQYEKNDESEEESDYGSDSENDNEKSTEGTSKPTNLLEPLVLIHANKSWASYSSNETVLIRPLSLDSEKRLVTTRSLISENIQTNGCSCSLGSKGNLIIGGFEFLPSGKSWFDFNSISFNEEHIDNEPRDEDEEDEDEETIEEVGFRCVDILSLNDQGKTINIIVENKVSKSNCTKISALDSKTNDRLPVICEEKQKFTVKLENIGTRAVSLTKFSTRHWHLVLLDTDNTLHTYELGFSNSKESMVSLKKLHETTLESQTYTMDVFRNYILIPSKNKLVLMDLGQKKLLVKYVGPAIDFVTAIVKVSVWEGERIAVGDVKNSVTLLQYNDSKKAIEILANDIVPRDVTAIKFLDRSTIIGGDKFSNIWTLRLSVKNEKLLQTCDYNLEELQKHLIKENGPLRSKAPNILDCPFKLDLITNMFINDIPTQFIVEKSIQMASRPVIIYVGVQGTIGALLPLLIESEATKLKKIEKMLRDTDELWFLKEEGLLEKVGGEFEKQDGEENENEISKMIDFGIDIPGQETEKVIEGRGTIMECDHIQYRGQYAPVKSVIDGDLCEIFGLLPEHVREFTCKQRFGSNNTKEIIAQLCKIRSNFM